MAPAPDETRPPSRAACGDFGYIAGMSREAISPKLKMVLLGGGAALVGVVVMATFLSMVGPAAAREVTAACEGLRSAEPKPVLCPDGKACSFPLAAPDFVAKDHEGKPVRLSDYRGKVVLLNFWASWCGVCKSEKPSLAQLSAELASDDFVVITLASDRQWQDILYALMASLAADKLDPALPTDASLAQMLAAYKKAMPAGTPFHVFLDEPASEDTQIGAIATAWGVGAVPESFLIDKAGRLRAYYVNSRDWNLGVARRCLRSVIDE